MHEGRNAYVLTQKEPYMSDFRVLRFVRKHNFRDGTDALRRKETRIGRISKAAMVLTFVSRLPRSSEEVFHMDLTRTGHGQPGACRARVFLVVMTAIVCRTKRGKAPLFPQAGSIEWPRSRAVPWQPADGRQTCWESIRPLWLPAGRQHEQWETGSRNGSMISSRRVPRKSWMGLLSIRCSLASTEYSGPVGSASFGADRVCEHGAPTSPERARIRHDDATRGPRVRWCRMRAPLAGRGVKRGCVQSSM
jgi:hypothetical protein